MASEAETIKPSDIPRLEAALRRKVEAAQSSLEAAQRQLDAFLLTKSLLLEMNAPVSKHGRLRDLTVEIVRKAERPLRTEEIVERAKQHGWTFGSGERNAWSSVNSVLSRRNKKEVIKLPDGRWEAVG